MAQVFLLPATASVGPGSGQFIGTQVTTANLQFVPNATTGFSGVISIDCSTSPAPGATDWFSVATLTFNAHTTIVDLNIYFSNNPWIRARVISSSSGSIGIYMAY